MQQIWFKTLVGGGGRVDQSENLVETQTRTACQYQDFQLHSKEQFYDRNNWIIHISYGKVRKQPIVAGLYSCHLQLTGKWKFWQKIMKSVHIGIAALAFVLSLNLCYAEDGAAVQYDTDSFNEDKGKMPMFVKFYAPWWVSNNRTKSWSEMFMQYIQCIFLSM